MFLDINNNIVIITIINIKIYNDCKKMGKTLLTAISGVFILYKNSQLL